MFVGIHATLAVLTETPELTMTEDEGEAFMKAAQKVAAHYSVQTTQKTIDWLAFMGVTANIYGTRAFAIQMRRQAQKEERSGKVINFPHAPRRREQPEQNASQQEPFVPSTPPNFDPEAPGF